MISFNFGQFDICVQFWRPHGEFFTIWCRRRRRKSAASSSNNNGKLGKMAKNQFCQMRTHERMRSKLAKDNLVLWHRPMVQWSSSRKNEGSNPCKMRLFFKSLCQWLLRTIIDVYCYCERSVSTCWPDHLKIWFECRYKPNRTTEIFYRLIYIMTVLQAQPRRRPYVAWVKITPCLWLTIAHEMKNFWSN